MAILKGEAIGYQGKVASWMAKFGNAMMNRDFDEIDLQF